MTKTPFLDSNLNLFYLNDSNDVFDLSKLVISEVPKVYTNEDYEELQKIAIAAVSICPPDVYQKRQNDLSKGLAEFLLKPYLRRLEEEKKDE